MSAFLTLGDYGDIIYAMPCMKLVAQEEGEPVTLYAKDGLRLHDPFIPRLPGIRRLVAFQSYIKDLLPWDGEKIDYDLSRFRDHGLPYGSTLGELQARAVGLLPDLNQRWLFAEPAATSGKIVIARSGRYHNRYMPWKQLLDCYGDQMLFIGHPHEHAQFCADFGNVRYLPTSDLYEAAQAIAGSVQFIGNQSSPYSIAEGLKHPCIQETSLESPDCIYRRANAAHCHDGSIDLNLFGRALHTDPVDLRPRATRNETPPGGWRVSIDGLSVRGYSLDYVITEIRMRLGSDVPGNLWDMIVEQSSVDMPPGEPEYQIRQLRSMLA